MKLNEAIAKRIKDLMKQRGLSGYALFKLTGIPQSTISTFLNVKLKLLGYQQSMTFAPDSV